MISINNNNKKRNRKLQNNTNLLFNFEYAAIFFLYICLSVNNYDNFSKFFFLLELTTRIAKEI